MSDSRTETLVRVCPECDEAAVRTRHPEKPCSPTNDDSQYGCEQCGATFDEPVRRPKKTNREAGSGSTLAANLVDADPEDVGGGA